MLSAQMFAASAPSGIAQLRQSVDASSSYPQSDAMNLDDFIQPSSIATPVESSPSPAPVDTSIISHSAVAAAIPIKTRKNAYEQPSVFPLASAPGPPHLPGRSHEFGYIQRHVRKTSIDDRMVCLSRPDPLVGDFG